MFLRQRPEIVDSQALLFVQVAVRGKVCPVVGYGGMNMHIIDISSVPDAEVRLCTSVASQSCSALLLSLCSCVPGQKLRYSMRLLEVVLGMHAPGGRSGAFWRLLRG